MAKQRNIDASIVAEPTNAQLADGSWEQPPSFSPQQVVVNVPDGVFAKLAQARERYEELTPTQFEAYRTVADFSVTSKDFALQGDMSSETATALATAVTSKVFDEITAYVPKPQHVDRCEPAVIGRISTANGGKRYFRVNAPTKGKWTTKDVMSAARSLASREWWADNLGDVLIGLLLLAMIAWPIVVAVVTANPMWLWWLLVEFVVVSLTAVLWDL